MELRQLRHFLEVVRRSSFGEAAAAVSLSQPAISKSIKTLEDSLRVQLVERTPSGVFPTPYGKVLFDYAQLIDNEIRRAEDEIAALRGSGRGIVRVGAGPSIIRNLLPDIVAGFGRRRGDVDVTIRQGSKEELFLNLRRGDIDIMISTINENDQSADLSHRIILHDHIDIVASAQHPLAEKERVELADLVPYRWVIPGTSEPERQYLQQLFGSAGLPMPKAIVQTMSLGFLSEFLPGTTYLSYSSRRLGGTKSGAAIVPLAIDLKEWSRPVGITTRSNSVILPAVRVFVEELDKAAARWASAN